jgi:hypothetical protein
MSVMIRLFIGPMIVGVFAFLFIYYISPVFISEPIIVSIVAEFALNWSNLYFDSMPPIVVSYISDLNRVMVALTVGLLITLVIQLLLVIRSTSIYITKWVITYLKKDREKDEALDLPSINMDLKFKKSDRGGGILGRGLDSIERD